MDRILFSSPNDMMTEKRKVSIEEKKPKENELRNTAAASSKGKSTGVKHGSSTVYEAPSIRPLTGLIPTSAGGNLDPPQFLGVGRKDSLKQGYLKAMT